MYYYVVTYFLAIHTTLQSLHKNIESDNLQNSTSGSDSDPDSESDSIASMESARCLHKGLKDNKIWVLAIVICTE